MIGVHARHRSQLFASQFCIQMIGSPGGGAAPVIEAAWPMAGLDASVQQAVDQNAHQRPKTGGVSMIDQSQGRSKQMARSRARCAINITYPPICGPTVLAAQTDPEQSGVHINADIAMW